VRVNARDTPAPYASNLIQAMMPQKHDVIKAVRRVMYLD
jgi:pyruvate/2-oxoglutarate/acetoin dehydrogenase E1 component